jgi:hypothetical protein
MPLSVWTQPSGYSLGTVNERQTLTIALPVSGSAGINFAVISGKLPRGLRIVGANIVGTPFEVVRTTEYTFVIRASNTQGLSDRTFKLTVVGEDTPSWLTPEGALPVGSNDAYYILDNSFVDFQLSTIDTDTAAGQKISFFIASDEGELPPGLILTSSGRITGFIQPLLAVPFDAGSGSYDDGLYDSVAFDFGYRSSNGYDTYVFDSTIFDFAVATGRPRKLNRNYEFIATVTDGDTVTKRKFRIFVVGDDFFRADNIVTNVGTGAYTADVTYVRTPIFTTPSDLGLRRANNYQTFKIDTYEGFENLGPISYQLTEVNALIDGACFKELSIDNRLGQSYIRFERASGVPQEGYKINFNGEFPGATGATYTITDVEVIGGDTYRVTVDPALEMTIPNGTAVYIGTDSVLPPGMQFDSKNAEVFGVVPYQPAITKSYAFTIRAIRYGQGTETSTSRRVFTVNILGEVDSVMRWVSPSNLGTIDAGFVSTLNIEAASSIVTSAVLYTLESGTLPPGLSLNLDGEIVGKVNQQQEHNVYKSFWKTNKNYVVNDIVKQSNSKTLHSATRKRNTGFIVTETDHNFATGDLINIISDNADFNFYSGVTVTVDPMKLIAETTRNGTGPYRITFSIPTQTVAPLAPIFTLYSGTAANMIPQNFNNVAVKSTSGGGMGARFRIQKGTKYDGGATTAVVMNPGSGYMPGDRVVISGGMLGGVDGVNDLTFTISTGLEFYYKINGNSNSNFNGRFFATSSTTTSITLHFMDNPGTFGTGLISVTTGPNTYEAQTQVTPLNYFSYPNKGSSIAMTGIFGVAQAAPTFYKSNVAHNSGSSFNSAFWDLYTFPEKDKTLTVLDNGDLTLDGNTTTLDRSYTFTVMARDQLGYSAITQTFSITVNTPNNTYYSNISVRPFLKMSQRNVFKEFIQDSAVFDNRYIYRPSDAYFGIQDELRMIIYAGIETKDAVEYISAMGRNHKAKRFAFGTVKKAIAYEPGTTTPVYEVVYVEMLDPLEKNGQYLSSQIKYSATNVEITVDTNNEFYNGPFTIDSPFWKRPIPLSITLDRNDIFAGDPATQWHFPSSISLWRKNIKNMANTISERNYLPLWMRSIQPGNTSEINYVAAVPLCYCKPGGADQILLNIKNNGFDFKQLDYTIDRYIIDSVNGEYTDKYLVFRNDRTTII